MTGPGRFLEQLTWPEVAAAFKADIPVVFPIGAAAKEHGHHLPMNNDWLLARALAEGVAARLPVLIAPIIPFGYYPVFRAYPGSQHLSADTFVRVLTELLEAYLDQGNGAMVVVERYVDADAFEAHLANPANGVFNAKLAQLLGGGGSSLQMLAPLG